VHGTTDDPRRTAEERFWSFVVKTDTCWLWTGRLVTGGYGMFAITHDTSIMAHRFAYELLIGPVPEGLELDHIWPRCQNKNCVRPDHLEPVTRGENAHRRAMKQTHCKRGHEFTDENTYRAPSTPTIRRCRACAKIHDADQSRKRREALTA